MAKGDTTFSTTPFYCKPEWGGIKKVYSSVTFDNYATGGYDFDIDTQFNVTNLRMLELPPTVKGFIPEYNATTKKLLMYVVGTGAGASTIIDKRMIEAPVASVPINQAAAEFFQYTVPAIGQVVGINVYCTATAATASVDVQKNSVSILTGVVTPQAGVDVGATIDGTKNGLVASDVLTVNVTTNGTGTITNLAVVIEIDETRTLTTGAGPLIELADNNATLNAEIMKFGIVHQGV